MATEVLSKLELADLSNMIFQTALNHPIKSAIVGLLGLNFLVQAKRYVKVGVLPFFIHRSLLAPL